jgi:DNA repair exonuclease SbcCD ATPase subunit
MFLVELVLQGVRGFKESARLRFKGGFNFVAAGNESGKTTAIDSLQRLLFPSNQAALLDELVSRSTPDVSRAALVTCSNEGSYYRMIQDFSKRGVNLSQYNPTNKDFSLLHKDWNSAAQFMVGMTDGIPEEDFARIFILRREHYAARPKVTTSAAAPRAAPSTPVPSAEGKSSGDQERLAELRETLRKAEEAADAEYKFESAKLERDEIAKKIASLDEIETKKIDMQSTFESLKGFEEMPENLGELIDEHALRQGKKLADVDDINGQLEGLKVQIAEVPTENLVTDKLFIVGVVVGAVSILAGMFMLTDNLRYLYFVGVLLSIILMVGAWYKGSRKTVRRKHMLKEEEKQNVQNDMARTLLGPSGRHRN